MPIVSVSDLCSGFWDRTYPSTFIEGYVTVSSIVGDNPTPYGSKCNIRGFILKEEELVKSQTAYGRPVWGYPQPLTTPSWINLSPSTDSPLINNIDYYLEDEFVWFFIDPLSYVKTPYHAWVNGSVRRWADVWYGEVLSSEDAISSPQATHAAISEALAEACDVEITGLTNETVEDVWQAEDTSWRVITSVKCYKVKIGDTPIWSTGDIIPPRSPLGTAWTLTQLGPITPNLSYVTTPPEFHQHVTVAGITWPNQTVNTIIDEDSGRTRIRWQLGGTQLDVDAFWTESHARGIDQGRTLAQCMDLRTSPNNIDPGPESLPSTINPFKFLCEQMLGGAAYLLVVRPSMFGDNALSTSQRQKNTKLAAGLFSTIFEYENSVPNYSLATPS